MKVILTKDHDQLGITGSTIEVSEGYARNYLIPHSLAVLATKNVQQHFDDRKKAVAKKEAAKLAKAQELGKQIEALSLKLTAKVGTEGKLYGAITNKEVAQGLHDQAKLEIDRKHIDIRESIRTEGTHTVYVKLHHKVTAALKVEVVAEG